MKTLTTGFKRHRWLLLLAAGVAGVFYEGEQPPGTNLMSAIVTLYALARKERDQVADQVAERIWQKLGQVVTTVETCQKDVTDLRAVCSDHAGHLDHARDWIKTYSPTFAAQPLSSQPVLRPAAR